VSILSNIPLEFQEQYIQARKEYLKEPWISGTSFGFKQKAGRLTNELCVRVHVPLKVPKAELSSKYIISSDFDVIQSQYSIGKPERLMGTFEDIPSNRTRVNILRPGVSICNEHLSAGTLGAIVYDRITGEAGILSNWHVLFGRKESQVGERVTQPGPFDGGIVPDDVVAILSRGMLNENGDAAFAKLLDNRPYTTIHSGKYGVRITNKMLPVLGLRVQKEGRTTGHTEGIIAAFVESKVSYSVGVKTINAIEIRPEGEQSYERNIELSAPGDSGSMWYYRRRRTAYAVGLHFAGEASGIPSFEEALACPITPIMEELNLSFLPQDFLNRSYNRRYHPSSSGFNISSSFSS
jgi:endonuclease G, mitochondrial